MSKVLQAIRFLWVQTEGIVRSPYRLYALIAVVVILSVNAYVNVLFSPFGVEWVGYLLIPGAVLCLFLPGCIHGWGPPLESVLIVGLNVFVYLGVPALVVRIIQRRKDRHPPSIPSEV